MTKNSNNESTKLRFDFIGMAFALALGQVGIEIGEFYSAGLSLRKYPHVLFQLLLGTYIIASSWVGWNKSRSKGNLETIDNTFGKPFLLLLIDLFLVICYFIIIKGVEKPYLEDNMNSNITAKPELFWSMVIMATYFIWDIVSKLISFNSKKFKFKVHFKTYLKRAYQAIICFSFLIILYNNIAYYNSYNTILIDIYILMVFILFRGLKENIIIVNQHRMTTIIKYFIYRVLPLISIFVLYYLITSI